MSSDTKAVPMAAACRPSSVAGKAASAPVGQTCVHAMHSVHPRERASMRGVPRLSSPASRPYNSMHLLGHTLAHCPQRIHSDRNASSSSVPGGRRNRFNRDCMRTGSQSTSGNSSVTVTPAQKDSMNPRRGNRAFSSDVSTGP